MRHRAILATIVGGLVISLAPPSPAGEPGLRRVPMQDIRFSVGDDITADLVRGTVQRRLPFALLWGGQRYERIEIGHGWVRGMSDAEIGLGELTATSLATAAAGAERATPRSTRFEVLAGSVHLGPTARVLVSESSGTVAIRWWDLRVTGVDGLLAAEIVIDRLGTVRYQYPQVGAIASRAAADSDPVLQVRVGVSGAGAVRLLDRGVRAEGFALANGAAYQLSSDSLIAMSLVPGPPPVGCARPTENWCDVADGPGGNAQIWIDTRFEEPVLTWTPGGAWHVIPSTTCPPGASTTPGQSAYVGVDATCTHTTSAAHNLTGPLIGPTVNAMMSFAFRGGYNFALGSNLLVTNGGIPFIQLGDISALDPNLWWRVNPFAVPAGATQLGFRFVGGTATALGVMVDDVYVFESGPFNDRCIREARYRDGDPTIANCADTVHNDWAFDENDFCVDCPYTFYALVECGTDMHLPLLDMEGADITVTDVIDPTNVLSLTCTNDTARNPGSPPVVFAADCCPTGAPDGINEQWTGPAWTATDNSGPGHVEWGFSSVPACPDIGTAYDLGGDGLTCSDLTPACGGLLNRLSPGEGQGVDCHIPGNPGLCGLFRIEVRSGGNVWNLFANCTGDTLPGFNLYYDCASAWTAFNPLPEVAVANATETGTCPNTQIRFDLQNVGCADLVGAITVRAETNCAPPDRVDWVIPGGLLAGATRTETQALSVGCSSATLTLTVDPLDIVGECSESGSAAACNVIPGADSINLGVCGCAGTVPPNASADEVCVGTATSLTCGTPQPGATYEWDFDGDAIPDATGCNVVHVFPSAGPFTVKVSMTTSGLCTAETTFVVTVLPATAPTASTILYMTKGPGPLGLHLQWTAVTGAVSARVARGTLGTWYDHTVDSVIGAGICDTLGALSYDDLDDLGAPADYYYLVAPLGPCDAEGLWGNGRESPPTAAPPPPIRTPSCP